MNDIQLNQLGKRMKKPNVIEVNDETLKSQKMKTKDSDESLKTH